MHDGEVEPVGGRAAEQTAQDEAWAGEERGHVEGVALKDEAERQPGGEAQRGDGPHVAVALAEGANEKHVRDEAAGGKQHEATPGVRGRGGGGGGGGHGGGGDASVRCEDKKAAPERVRLVFVFG